MVIHFTSHILSHKKQHLNIALREHNIEVFNRVNRVDMFQRCSLSCITLMRVLLCDF